MPDPIKQFRDLRVLLRKLEENLNSVEKGGKELTLSNEDFATCQYYMDAVSRHGAEVTRWAIERCKQDLSEARELARAHARAVLDEVSAS